MIHYSFLFGPGKRVDFTCDAEQDSSIEDPEKEYPRWMDINEHRCPACGIPQGSRRTCPAALALAPVLEAFGDHFSYDEITVEVRTNEVKLTLRTTTQQAIRSLAGLLLASSACNILGRLKPMARFHLPFGDAQSTVFRVAGTYLMAQYLREQEGLTPDRTLEGLLALFSRIHEVNQNLAKRLRSVAAKDAAVNSLVILDAHGMKVESAIESQLRAFKPIFSDYFK